MIKMPKSRCRRLLQECIVPAGEWDYSRSIFDFSSKTKRRKKANEKPKEEQQMPMPTQPRKGKYSRTGTLVVVYDLDGSVHKTFASLKEAADDMDKPESTIASSMQRHGLIAKKWRFRRVPVEDADRPIQPLTGQELDKRIRKGSAMRPIVKLKDGVVVCRYSSVKEAVAASGLPYSAMHKRIAKGSEIDGIRYKYEDN